MSEAAAAAAQLQLALPAQFQTGAQSEHRPQWRPPRTSRGASGSGGKGSSKGGDTNEAKEEKEQPWKRQRQTHQQMEIQDEQQQYHQPPTGKGTKQRTRRVRQPGKSEKRLMTKDPAMRTLLLDMLKLTTQTAARTRALMGATYDTWLIPADHPVAKALEAENQAFHQAVKEWRQTKQEAKDKGQALPAPWGAPAPTIFLEMLEAMATCDVGEVNRKALRQIAEDGTKDREILVARVPICRLETTAQSAVRKLSVAMRAHPQREHIIKAASQLADWQYKEGAAPQGHLEQELSEWIRSLTITD